MAKVTVYIEADDEITTVIDKVVSAKDDIVAVVLPKRASVFQSVVNLKLLKNAAHEADKKVVLISSEPAIELMAAIAVMHVAKSLSSKPFIPKRATIKSSETTISSKEFAAETADSKGFKIVDSSEEPSKTDYSADDTIESDVIELDNTEEVAQELPEGSIASNMGSEKSKKKRGFKIPDFSSFRLRMGLGITAFVLLVVGWFFGFVIMPKATITINTDTSSQTVTMDFIAKTDATELDAKIGVIPAKKSEVSKEDKVTVATTGEKNVGEKATGIVTLTNCKTGTSGVTIPAGTGFSSGNLTFVTTEAIELGPAVIIGVCRSADFPDFGAVKDVAVAAANSGEEYNIAAKSLTSSVSGVSAYGSAMVGGTNKVVKVVSETDLTKAREQLKGTATADATTELKAKLSEQKLQALLETLEQTEPVIKNSSAVNAEATEVTVTQTVKYSMLGVASSDIGAVLDARIEESLKDSPDKNVRSNGLDKAVYRLATKISADNQTITIQAIAILGPEFDEAIIRKEIVGKKRGEIEKMLESRDGVKSVGVEYSPFWITTTPKKESKITIVINELEN